MAARALPTLEHAHRLHRAGRLREATAAYKRLLHGCASPALRGDAWHGLSVVAFEKNDDERAVRDARSAIAAHPTIAKYHLHLGHILQRLRRGTEAVHAYFRAAELEDGNFEALFKLGALLTELQRPREALSALQLALQLNPEHADVHLYVGHCKERLGQLDEAIQHYLTTLSLQPKHARGFLLLGGALVKVGHAIEGDTAFARSLEIDPHQSAARSRRIAAMNYRADLTAREVAAAHKDWDVWHGVPLRPSMVPKARPLDGRPLRIGYISPNFYRHSVAHFLLPMLRARDREKFQVYLYAENAIEDGTTAALREIADGWRHIHGTTSDKVAEQIRADRIDILVELAGHTGDNRLLVLARKPAPVQVHWLGYPATTGLSAIDFRLSDAITEPVGEADELSAERIIRLPHGFHCFGRPGEDPAGDGCEGETLPVGPLPATTNGYVSFGSFNMVQKMPPPLVRAWARILAAVPNSRLLLKSFPDEVVAQRFRALFEENGVDPARIEFLHMTEGRVEHLQLYNRMDIALDPFPYNGTTTTCEALWMGVPVVTLVGDRHVARVGASLLTRVGLKDWIAPDQASYIEQAIRRATDLPALVQMRSTLRDRMRSSPLCDAKGFARDIENAFSEMWDAVQKE